MGWLCLIIKLFLTCIFLAYFNIPTVFFTICHDRWDCYGAMELSVFLMNSFLITSWFNSKTEKLYLKPKAVWIHLMKDTKVYMLVAVTACLVSSIDQEGLQAVEHLPSSWNYSFSNQPGNMLRNGFHCAFFKINQTAYLPNCTIYEDCNLETNGAFTVLQEEDTEARETHCGFGFQAICEFPFLCWLE